MVVNDKLSAKQWMSQSQNLQRNCKSTITISFLDTLYVKKRRQVYVHNIPVVVALKPVLFYTEVAT